MENIIINNFRDFSGDTSFVYKNLVTGESFSYNEDFPHVAASIIKLPIMVAAFAKMEKGILDPEKIFELKKYEKVPPAGVLTFMNSNLTLTAMDLIYLMIAISDNMATNMLIDCLGIDNINFVMKDIGLKNTVLERKLFDKSPENAHKMNKITTGDMALILEKIYQKTLISKSASEKMLDIMLSQQLNDKIPMFLPLDYKVAHKTGDISTASHDVGIVFAKEPFILCCAGSNIHRGKFNMLIGETAKIFFDHSRGIDESMLGD